MTCLAHTHPSPLVLFITCWVHIISKYIEIVRCVKSKNMNGQGLFMEMSKKKSQYRYIPKPLLGKWVIITTTFLDSNLLHNIVTIKSVTAVLHFVNTTPTDWFSKRQANCGDSNIWFRVCSMQYNLPYHHPPLPSSPSSTSPARFPDLVFCGMRTKQEETTIYCCKP